MALEKQRSARYRCLDNNIVIETFVVVLTLASGLAITGENLITFNLITVPRRNNAATNDNSTNSSNKDGDVVVTENRYAMNFLDHVFHYTSLGIAGLFFLEILLKVFILQKRFVTHPWQIFDIIVVLATLGVELAFHFFHFSERAVYSVTYIVILRLWRVPVLCKIRSNDIQESSEQDIEQYIYGNRKTDERCVWLESRLSEQAKTIIKLEGMLHNLTASNPSDMPNRDFHGNKNGHMTPGPNHVFGELKESSDKIYVISKPRKKNTLQKDPQQTEMKEQLSGTCKTETTVLGNDVAVIKEVSHDSIQVQSIKTTEDQIDSANNNVDTIYSAKEYSDFMDGIDKNAAESITLPLSITSYSLLSTASPTSNIPWRLRKRRSSTSEIVDYSSLLNSPSSESVFTEETNKSASCPSLDLENENTSNAENDLEQTGEDSSNLSSKIIDNSESVASGPTQAVSSVNKSRISNSMQKKRSRRLSCPEYVYTQRMSITNDESLLIEDGHNIHNLADFDNLGLDYNENSRLHVLAEFDGTKTYRNEDGIPMTSL